MAFKAYYWEYLTIWANSFFAGESGRGLLEVHLFAQWIEGVIGWGGSILVLAKIFKKLDITRPVAWLAVMAGAGSSTLAYTVWNAKNDWGVIFWVLCGLWFLMGPIKRLVWSGAFFGLGVGGKYTVVLAVLPFILGWDIKWREKFRVAAAMALALTPLLLRNWVETGNPFFPVFNGVFESPWVSGSVGAYYGQSQWNGGREFVGLLQDRIAFLYKREFLLVVTALVGTLLFPLGILFRFAWSARHRFCLLTLIGIGFFLTLVGSNISAEDGNLSLRLMGPSLVLGLSCGILLILEVFKNQQRIWRAVELAVGVLMSGFIFKQSLLPTFDPHQVGSSFQKLSVAVSLVPLGGMAKTWLRQNASEDDLVVTTGDNQLYYLAHLRVAPKPDQPDLDRIDASGPLLIDEYLEVLVSLGAKYLLDTRHFDRWYWSYFALALDKEIEDHPEAVLFEAKDCMVVDPQRLLNEMKGSCVNALNQRAGKATFMPFLKKEPKPRRPF